MSLESSEQTGNRKRNGNRFLRRNKRVSKGRVDISLFTNPLSEEDVWMHRPLQTCDTLLHTLHNIAMKEAGAAASAVIRSNMKDKQDKEEVDSDTRWSKRETER